MQKSEVGEFLAFLTVADHGGFARAGAKLGVTASAISQTMRKLELRLGVRLMNRTTRSIQLTEAGIHLASELRLAFDQIERAGAAASAFGDQATGTVRLTTSAVAAELLIRPNLAELQRLHPGISLELSINEQIVDIVGQRFDCGIRRGDLVGADMVSHRISPDIRMLAVASPAYLATAPAIEEPRDLRVHNCIRIRSIGTGGVPPWRFGNGILLVDVKVGGTIAVDTTTVALAAALNGTGIAYLGSDFLAPSLRSGQLVVVLEDWAISRPGFHLCYPGRRQVPQPLITLTQFLKARAG
jgi:DNA-binding transcriptional LysR family regulator